MIDKANAPFERQPGNEPAIHPLPQVQVPGHRFPIVFSGSGTEYFRIWIVNLLLTLATLGLYYPWAKVRTLRYFHRNTTIDDHAFDFHGNPRRMLRGYLLVGAMALAYVIAGWMSRGAGAVAGLLVASVAPALFRASLQFRMSHTSWRGVRFRFTGAIKGAYKPLAIGLSGLGLTLVSVLVIVYRTAPKTTPDAAAVLIFLPTFASMLVLPLMWWSIKKYQYAHYAFGQVQTSLRTKARSFYWLCLKTFALSGLVAFLIVGAVNTFMWLFPSIATSMRALTGSATLAILLAGLISIAVTLPAWAMICVPFFTARAQNLIWGDMHSPLVRFESNLQFEALAGLAAKNFMLTLITLGLYRPFARVSTARLRLHAVTVHLMMSPDEFADLSRAPVHDAIGEAAGDFFGIDIGL
jgi:uncharacterized membrane protein YjgN (DUF898 family)